MSMKFLNKKHLSNVNYFHIGRCISTSRINLQLPKKCDAVIIGLKFYFVIIGGGSIGCSTLYHLAKLGFTNTVLLERNKLTSGTTWHTAGLVWSLRPSDIDIQLLQITRDMLGRLEKETGINPGWNNNGGLFLASTKERLDEYTRLHTAGKPFGIHSEVLSPSDTKKLVPIIDEKTLYGTIFSPSDGNVDPSGLCTALTRFATNNGSKVFENCIVNGINTKDSTFGTREIVEVETNLGTIQTNIVVNCTGAWAPQICKMIGIEIPLIPMKHSYVVFDRIEEVKGLPNIRDHDEAIYFRIQSDTLSIGGYEMNPIILDQVDPDFAFGLYELDWDVFGTHIKGACKRIPMLEKVGIKSTICGPESFTPDHKPLLGNDPHIDGFIHGCGFNSAGMMFSGGCGSQLAKWVINGTPDVDMFSYDIRRFNPKIAKNKQWATERSHEAYAKNYSIVYKNDEPLGGRNQVKSPIYDSLLQKGCFFQERQGWERPGYFGNSKSPPLPYDWYGEYGHKNLSNEAYPKALSKEYSFQFPTHHKIIESECESCRNNAAVFDMSYFGKLFLVGKDAMEAAQWIFSNQMDKKPGSVVYTCFLNQMGKIEADLTATVLDSSHRLPTDPNFNGIGYYLAIGGTTAYYTQTGINWELKKKGFNVQLIPADENYGLLSVQGPKSRETLQELFPNNSFSNQDFPFSTHQILQRNGVKVRVMRLSFVGEMGWELHIDNENCKHIYNDLFKIGEKHGLRNAGYRAIDSLSIEKGYKHWHADIRSDDSPLEAGLGFTCKLKTDVDFLGRKSLEEEKQRGIGKKLVCFTLEDQIPLWGLEAIWEDEEPVGYVRRAEFGFHIKKSIAYGYLKPSSDLFKRNYFIESLGKKYKANAHSKSPFDPDNKRIQGFY